jgi:hypothetical protein
MQCGAPVEIPCVAPQAPKPALDFVQPALTGGMFLGLFSSIPFISAGNFICCMWVLAGGGIAAFLLTKQRPTGISYGDGAFAGVLSGLFGAIVATILSIPIRILSARILESQQQALEDLLQQAGAEGPFRDLMMRLLSPEISFVTVLFTFFMNLLVFALFAMIGGILMVAILNKRRMRPPVAPMT